jgi:hypothetical protein
MSEFTESSLDYNGVNDSTLQNNDTKSEFQNSDKYKKDVEDVEDVEDAEDEKQGFHFVYEENIIKSHPDINTNIIFSEHSEKLINFGIFEYNYKDKNFCYDSENYKFRPDTEYTNKYDVCSVSEHNYFFIAKKIYSDEKVIIVEGTVGYSYDPTNIKLIYDLVENKIYVASYYRFLHSVSDCKLFFDKYKMTNGLVILNKTNSDGKTESLVKISNDECKLIESELDSIPYFRFPRSKDGVTIPRTIYNIFKVFENNTVTHPEIIIPSEFYVYSDAKFTKFSE